MCSITTQNIAHISLIIHINNKPTSCIINNVTESKTFYDATRFDFKILYMGKIYANIVFGKPFLCES